MLFDLRSPGRRNVIRVVYAMLAILMGGGLIFFGIGGAGSGGLLDAFTGGGGGGDASSAFEDDINAAQERVAANPQDAAAYAELVQLRYQAGTQNVEVDDQGRQTITEEGKQQLEQGADAWNKYLKLSAQKPASGTASLAVQTFAALADASLLRALTSGSGTEALDFADDAVADWEAASEAQQILLTSDPSASGYSNLAFFLYRAGNSQEAAQAGNQALALAKGGEKSQIQQELKSSQKDGQTLTTGIAKLREEQQKQQAASGGAAGGTGGANSLEGLSGGGLSGGGLSGGGLSSP